MFAPWSGVMKSASLFFLAIGCASPSAVAEAPVLFTLVSETGRDSAPIRESDLRRLVPQLQESDQVQEVCSTSMTYPLQIVAVMSPVVSGDHRVAAKWVTCSYLREVKCDLTDVSGVFDHEPGQWFYTGHGVPLDEALAVHRLFRSREFSLPEGMSRDESALSGLMSSIHRDESALVIGVGPQIGFGCGGCISEIRVEPEFEAGNMVRLRVLEQPDRMCI